MQASWRGQARALATRLNLELQSHEASVLYIRRWSTYCVREKNSVLLSVCCPNSDLQLTLFAPAPEMSTSSTEIVVRAKTWILTKSPCCDGINMYSLDVANQGRWSRSILLRGQVARKQALYISDGRYSYCDREYSFSVIVSTWLIGENGVYLNVGLWLWLKELSTWAPYNWVVLLILVWAETKNRI